MRDYCGGCHGLGSHWRWCPVSVGYSASFIGQLAEEAESLGDRVGSNNPGAANHLYAAAGLLYKDAGVRKENYRAAAE